MEKTNTLTKGNMEQIKKKPRRDFYFGYESNDGKNEDRKYRNV